MTVRPDGPDDEAATVSALATVVELLAKAGGYVVAATLVAYGLGWRTANTYYEMFGAAWLTTDLRTMELLSFAGGWCLFVLLLVLFFTSQLAEGEREYKRSRNRIGTLAAGLCWMVWILSDQIGLGPHLFLLSWICGVGSYIWGWVVADGVCRIIEDLRVAGRGWRALHLREFHYMVAVALVMAPYLLGTSKALMDRSPMGSSLSTVLLSDNNLHWRLLRSSGDNLVLAKHRRDACARAASCESD